MKKIVFLSVIMVITAALAASPAVMNQSETAKKYASEGESPVVIFDPDGGRALGFLLFGNIDNEPDEELIIAYSKRVKESERENKALTHNQQLLVYIIKNGEKLGPIIVSDIEYIRKPRAYVKIEKVYKNEPSKVFLMVYDGLDKGKGPDNVHTVFWNGMSPADLEREHQTFSTVIMPWKFILNKFSTDTPTVTVFERNTRESHGKFYIQTLEKGAEWPKIPMKKINEFEEEVRKHQEHIFWEYGS